jgi:hypothetical protein
VSLKLNIWMTALTKRMKERGVDCSDSPYLTCQTRDNALVWDWTLPLSGWNGSISVSGGSAEECLEKAQKWVEEWAAPKPEDLYPLARVNPPHRPIHLGFDPRDIVHAEWDFASDNLHIAIAYRGGHRMHRIRREYAIDWGLSPRTELREIRQRLIQLSDPRYFDPYARPLKGDWL